jgi:DNA-binding GntR family transcriptional regulator
MLSLRVLQLHHLSLSAPGRLTHSLHDHERLLEAYADRDAPLAVAITRSIVNSGYRAIESSRQTHLTKPAHIEAVPLSRRHSPAFH